MKKHSKSALTDYSLGELSQTEHRRLAQEINHDPAMAKELSEIDEMANLLESVFHSEDREKGVLKLRGHQREAIYRAGRGVKDAGELSSTHKTHWLRPVLATLATAAAVLAVLVVMDHTEGRNEGLMAGQKNKQSVYEKLNDQMLLAPVIMGDAEYASPKDDAAFVEVTSFASSGSQDILSQEYARNARALRKEASKRAVKYFLEASPTAEPRATKWVENDPERTLNVPMVAGDASWQWLQRAVLEKGKKPSNVEVRGEEVLNHFSYDCVSDIQLDQVGLTAELVTSEQGEQTLMIAVKNAGEGQQVAAGVRFSDAVTKYALFGYDAADDDGIPAASIVSLAEGQGMVVCYDLVLADTLATGDAVAELALRVGHEEKRLSVAYSGMQSADLGNELQLVYQLKQWLTALKKGSSTQVAAEAFEQSLQELKVPEARFADLLEVMRKLDAQ